MKVKLLFLILIILTVKISDAQWQPDTRLTNDPANSFMSNNNARCLASSGNNIHAVWFENRDGNFEIYYKRSIDGGQSWGDDTRLTFDPAYSSFPSMSVSDSLINIVWEDTRNGNREIYHKLSIDNGNIWGPDSRLTFNTAISGDPTVTVTGSVVHVFWVDCRDGNWELYYKRSPDGGLSWGADTRLTVNWASSQFPSVTSLGSDVHVVWEENRDGNNEIYIKHSTDQGISWCPDTRLTWNNANSYSPNISVSDSVIHISWFDDRDGNFEIYYKHSTDNGATWCPDTRLTNNWAVSKLASIYSSGSNVHILWQDNRDGNYEIYYKRSVDEGTTWTTDLRLTNNSASSILPFVSVSGSSVYVLWEEYRDGNPELYFKRDSTGNPVSINMSASMIIEGFYNSYNCLNTKDTVRAFLRKNSSPYNIVDSAKAIIDSLTYNCNYFFKNAPTGSYYLVIKHRNSIETWSRNGGEALVKGTTVSYDFTNTISKAFGNNMKQLGNNKFGFFSGDQNQDGKIDVEDIVSVFNDAVQNITSVTSDINGDRYVDVSDLVITYNNSVSLVSMVRP